MGAGGPYDLRHRRGRAAVEIVTAEQNVTPKALGSSTPTWGSPCSLGQSVFAIFVAVVVLAATLIARLA